MKDKLSFRYSYTDGFHAILNHRWAGELHKWTENDIVEIRERVLLRGKKPSFRNIEHKIRIYLYYDRFHYMDDERELTEAWVLDKILL